MVDTGAESSNYLTESMWNIIKGQGYHLKICVKGHRVANNTELKTIGEVILPIKIDNVEFMVDIVVVKSSLPYSLILGWEQFVQKYQGVIDSTNNTLGLQYPGNNILYVNEEYHLTPFSETVVYARRKDRYEKSVNNILISQYDPLMVREGV